MAYKKYELSGKSGTEITRWFFLGQPLIIVTSIIAGVAEALLPWVFAPWLVLFFVIRVNAYALRSIFRASKSRSYSRMTKLIWLSSFYSIYFFLYGIVVGPVYYYYRDEVTSFAWFYLLSPQAIWEFVGLYIETGYEISSFSVNGLLLGLVLLAECSLFIFGYLIGESYLRDKISESRVFCEGCNTWAVAMNSKLVSYEEVAIDALESVEAAINRTALSEIASPCLGVITLGCPICKKSLAIQLENVTVSQDNEGTLSFERMFVGVFVPEVGTIPPIGTNPEVFNKNPEGFNKKSL